MSFWVHAFCERSASLLSPRDFQAGIARRLEILTDLFCPDVEEDPEEVLRRLRVEDHSATPGVFQAYLIKYRSDAPTFIRVDRNDRGAIAELEADFLAGRSEPGIDVIRRALASATEDVSFCLKSYDLAGMGFPIAIAAAAYVIEEKGGLIQSGTYSWMVPDGNEVRMLLELNA